MKIGTETLLRILTIFADDYHLADAFTSLPAFEHLLDVVAVLFRTLTAFGMEVSAGKSKAILALRGSLSSTIRKKYVRPATDGSGQVLRIQSRDQAFCIPLTSQFTYLGAQVSYSIFEQQTLTSRLAKGEACYHRLGAVLKGRHHLTQPQRLHLWRSCIWTTVAYGLTTCGLNEAGVQTLNTAMIKQLRAVLRLPAHISKTTNEEVCRQARLPLPNIMLRNLMQAEGRRHAARPPDELVCGPDHSWWSTVQHSLSPQVSKTLIRLAPSKVEAHVCPTCGVSYSTRAALKTHVTKQHATTTETQPEVPGFSKLADSSAGLSRCKHCEKCFPTWQLLERHIAGGHCHARPVPDLPAKPSSMLESGPNVVADIKLAHHPDMLQLITTYGPNFILHVAERYKYLQKCLICGQWLATSKVVKLHYKGSHPEVYQHTARASLECGKFPGSGCPCAYCGCKTKQPRHHKLQCSVLWQFCLTATYHSSRTACEDDKPGSATSGSLRLPGHITGGGIRSCSPRGSRAGPGPSKPSQQGSESGRRQETTPQGGQSNLLLLWKSCRKGGPRSSEPSGRHQGHGTPSPETGDQHPGPQAELSLGPLPAAGVSGTTAHALQGVGGLSRGSQEQKNGPPSSGTALKYFVPDGSSMHTGHWHHAGADQNCAGQRLDEPGGQVGLPALGFVHSGPCSGRDTSTHGASGTGGALGSDGSLCAGQRRDSSIQCHSPALGGSERNLKVSLGSGLESPWRGRSMDGTGENPELVGPSGGRHAAQTRWSSTLQFGSRSPEDAGRVLSLALTNPSQHCYMNAFALSWLWTHSLLQAPEAQLFGIYQQAWRDILYGPTANTISQLASWRQLLRGWARPASQHDVAEFIQHIFCRQQPLVLQGQWQSRVALGTEHVAISDEGSLLSPIILHPASANGPDTLQACVDRWHQQEAVHGLTSDHSVLVLQLARYHIGDNGTTKDRTEVRISQKMHVPIFGHGLTTFRATYAVSAILLHHGTSLQSGHYTSILLEPSALPRGSCWGTDDRRSARRYTVIPKCVDRDSYIIILARCRFC